MRCFIGIDLGSTTTKAVVIDEHENVLGRGITNSRSNYDMRHRSRSRRRCSTHASTCSGRRFRAPGHRTRTDGFLGQLERDFRSEQYLEQLSDLESTCQRNLGTAKFGDATKAVGEALTEVFASFPPRHPRCSRRAPSASPTSSATSPAPSTSRPAKPFEGIRHPLRLPAQCVRPLNHRGREPRLRRFDPAAPAGGARANVRRAARHREPPGAGRGADQGHPRHGDGGDLRCRHRLRPRAAALRRKTRALRDPDVTGWRAHDVSGSATVLDIGGQDIKAIQVDPNGIVEKSSR